MFRPFPLPPLLPTFDHHRASAEQDHDLQRLLDDNRRLTAGVVDLDLEISDALRHLRSEEAAAARMEAEWMAELGCLRKRAGRLAAEVVSLPALDTELVFARAAVERGAAEMRELEEKRRVLKAELDEVRDKGLQVRSVEKDIDLLKQEIKRGRMALQVEKEVQAENLEQNRAMECKINSLSSEIKKLQVELSDAEKRERASAAAAAAVLQKEVAAFVKMVDGLGMECALDGGVISIKRKSIDNED